MVERGHLLEGRRELLQPEVSVGPVDERLEQLPLKLAPSQPEPGGMKLFVAVIYKFS